jgi:1,4-dihydroxy-2-naphthoyl-CoA hydrolase
MIWFKSINIDDLNKSSRHSLVAHLGIEYTEIGENYLCGRMPVDERTMQPYGILHGGASVVLAETLGGAAAIMCLNPEEKIAVGLEINANHLRSVKSGFVYGKAEPLHIGKSTHVWQISMHNEANQPTCISRITIAILDKV